MRSYDGPALFSYGFRPFFLFGSLYVGLAVMVWLPLFTGQIVLVSAFAPRDWHAHEMLYGYVPAVVTGFLLTAIPNWTGRLPLQGRPLMALFTAWLAGRAAIALSGWIGWATAAAVDVAFLVLVLAAAAREIAVGKNWGNLKIVAIVSLFAAGNLLFHLEVHFNGTANYSIRLGLAVVILLISLVGGRIIPSFTRNWLARHNPGRLPRPFGRYDMITLAASAVVLVLWIASPYSSATGLGLAAVGLLHLVRLATWAGDRTLADRLVLVLHAAYAFVPIGFLLLGAAAVGMLPPSAGIHAWTAGAVGTMTLAVMTRASLGHTGRELSASAGTQLVYLAVVVGATARVCASIHPGWDQALLALSGLMWAAAFMGFVAIYAPILCGRRVDLPAAA
jgi:uncharacterized protein involved in response to NO